MRSDLGRRVASRRWLGLALAGWLAALSAGVGCRKQKAPTAPAGAIYYTGPKAPKGGAPGGPASGR